MKRVYLGEFEEIVLLTVAALNGNAGPPNCCDGIARRTCWKELKAISRKNLSTSYSIPRFEKHSLTTYAVCWAS